MRLNIFIFFILFNLNIFPIKEFTVDYGFGDLNIKKTWLKNFLEEFTTAEGFSSISLVKDLPVGLEYFKNQMDLFKDELIKAILWTVLKF